MPDDDEDLFESTKMTFGEHLDELRRSLIKSVLALVIGFLVALLFAGSVVDYVQTPLKESLSRITTAAWPPSEYRQISRAASRRRATPCRRISTRPPS